MSLKSLTLVPKSPYNTTRGLISKTLLFLHDIHAPLNSSFTSAVRTKKDYRKRQW